MKYTFLGLGFIVVWVLGVFVGNLDSRWMHAFLAVGAVLIAIGIVLGGEEKESGGE
jgi:undecaprenyl pyrophosphate phosphatase UppP